MLDLKAYRLGFAPALVALVVVAFSLEGVPEPLEPAAGTLEFDPAGATDETRALLRVAPDRRLGTEGAAAAADLVRRSFEEIASGSVAEQRFEASVDGDDVELRNVLLTLPGATDRAIMIVAERSSREGPGAPSSAAATGVLVELASLLGVSGRERTLIFGSIDGAGAEAQGAREMFEALPARTVVDAAVVISQPGSAEPAEPHLVTSSGGEERPSQELIGTAGAALAARARASPGLEGTLGQVARLALPAAAGAQAALLAEGVDTVAISSAGEVPLPAEESGEEQLSPESIERFGAAVLALVGSLDMASEAGETAGYVRLGDNTVPSGAIALLALALLAPPAVAVALALARAGGAGGTARLAARWASGWALVGLAPVLGLYALGFAGLIPRPEVPFDPGRFALGPLEVIALLVLAGTGFAAWRALGLRRPPATAPAMLGAAAGGVCLAACVGAWLVNPFLALVMAPLAHVVMVHAGAGRRPAALAIPVAALAALPVAATVAFVAGSLDWGVSAPWQLAVLVAGGAPGLAGAGAFAVALAALVAVVRSALLSPGLGAAPQERPRGRP